MILVDFSSIIFRKMFTSIKHAKPSKIDDVYITAEFIHLAKYYVLQELFQIKQEFSNEYRDIIICLDDSKNGYWRKDIYPQYKENRKARREKSEINYTEVFEEIDKLIEQIRENLPWKVLKIDRAEADDIILILAEEFKNSENILIHSPDKDLIQAQKNTQNVQQYSSLTKKFMKATDKFDSMEAWLIHHIVLGDAVDGIPKIVDCTELSPKFLVYLEKRNYGVIKTPMDFKENDTISIEKKKELIQNFDVYKSNRNKESTCIKDIYKKINFGSSKLKKKIHEFGGLNNWLDSHPLYKQHYERNFKLIMSEGIPENIRNQIIINFKEAISVYNDKNFKEYLIENNLKSILFELPSVFRESRGLTADDFNW
jgi:5'-3' exonuclease